MAKKARRIVHPWKITSGMKWDDRIEQYIKICLNWRPKFPSSSPCRINGIKDNLMLNRIKYYKRTYNVFHMSAKEVLSDKGRSTAWHITRILFSVTAMRGQIVSPKTSCTRVQLITLFASPLSLRDDRMMFCWLLRLWHHRRNDRFWCDKRLIYRCKGRMGR
jgi:hypothetical protein